MLPPLAALFSLAAAAWPPARAGHALPRLLLGPNAHHENALNETLAFLGGEHGAWDEVRERVLNRLSV